MVKIETFSPELANSKAAELLEIRVRMYSEGANDCSRDMMRQNLESAQFLSPYARNAILFKDRHHFVFVPRGREIVSRAVFQQFGIDLNTGKLGIHGDKTGAFLSERSLFESQIDVMRERAKGPNPLRNQGSWEQWEAYIEQTEKEIWPVLKYLDGGG